MAIILFDHAERGTLYPFTFTKALGELMFGIFTMQERWASLLKEEVFLHTASYLQLKYPIPPSLTNIWIDAAVIPEQSLLQQIVALEPGSALKDEFGLIAGKSDRLPFATPINELLQHFPQTHTVTKAQRLQHPWEMMQWNDTMIRFDFDQIVAGRVSEPIPANVQVLNSEQVFIEKGATLSFCTLNASTGPIYIGKNAVIMEGTVIRGPFSMSENSIIKMNSRIYGATSLGPSCMGGGEIKNSIMMGYSNKAHDGYLGDSVVGEWCNFGAGSTNSNIKNTAGDIKIWDIYSNSYSNVGNKCGVIMGDYSRVAINSSINTGSMIGLCANVFGAGLLPTIIPNFSWGVKGTKYVFEKALTDINNWKKLKGQSLTSIESSLLHYIFEHYS